MKRKTLIVVISSLLCLQLYGQHVLKVSLGDVAPYDSLKCHITGAGMKLPVYNMSKNHKSGFLTYRIVFTNAMKA